MPETARLAARQGAPGLLRLRLLATTDLHMHILPWDYPQARPAQGRGLAGLAKLIAEARGEVPNTLLFDNGDFLQGSALGDRLALSPVGPHPMIAAMNRLGYDAATLGNHEFGHGLRYLSDALGQARFPVVASNLNEGRSNLFTESDQDTLPPFLPHLLLTRMLTDEAGETHALRIGVLGFLPPQTAQWEWSCLNGRFVVSDILSAARGGIDRLRRAGADLVIALSHSGIDAAPAATGMENASAPLAALDGIDAVIAGHAHLAFPSAGFPAAPGLDVQAGTLHGKPAVMPGAYGSHLGVIDLLVQRGPDERWIILSGRSHLRPNPATGSAGDAIDPAITAITQPAHQDTLEWLARPVGRTERGLSTYFALVAPCHALRLTAQAKARHVSDRLKGTALQGLPVLATAAPFRAGGRGGAENYTAIPAGQVLMRHVLDLYPHANTIAALRLTGAEVADWLEHAAGLFLTIRAGRKDQPLCRPDVPSFQFDLIDGLEFAIDLSQPPRFDLRGEMANPDAHRITGLRWQGRSVRPHDQFIIATDSYRAGGAGGFAGANPLRLALGEAVPVRDILVSYIETRGTALPPTAARWGFAPMPETTVTFDTSPEAEHHLRDAQDLAPEPIGATEDGFLRFRLAL